MYYKATPPSIIRDTLVLKIPFFQSQVSIRGRDELQNIFDAIERIDKFVVGGVVTLMILHPSKEKRTSNSPWDDGSLNFPISLFDALPWTIQHDPSNDEATLYSNTLLLSG